VRDDGVARLMDRERALFGVEGIPRVNGVLVIGHIKSPL
jgi:hypothetical protein